MTRRGGRTSARTFTSTAAATAASISPSTRCRRSLRLSRWVTRSSSSVRTSGSSPTPRPQESCSRKRKRNLPGSTQLPGRFSAIQCASTPTRDREDFRNLVGAGDSARPEEVTNSPQISVKNGAVCRANVGIDPYEPEGKCFLKQRKVSRSRWAPANRGWRQASRDDRSSRGPCPWRALTGRGSSASQIPRQGPWAWCRARS